MITYTIDERVSNKDFLKKQIEQYLPVIFDEPVQETKEDRKSVV